ncbi:MAG: DUF4332 domain-containing protein [Thermoplasmatota archaeon]
MDERSPQASSLIRYFRGLALVLTVGVVLAIVLAKGNITGPGWFTPQQAFFGLAVVGAFVFIVTVLFLLKIGAIFELEKSMQKLYDGAEERAASAQAKIMQDWDSFKSDLRKDLQELKNEWRTEQGIRDRNIDDAMNAARAAMKAAQAADARIAGFQRDPSQAIAIERLTESMAGLTKSVAELKARDNVNSPLLKELQETVGQLVKNQTKLIQRIDTTVEAIERREIENAAVRANAEREVGDVKRREALLAVRARELEALNEHLEVEARQAQRPSVHFNPGEEAEHVMTIDAIGPANASRLNAVGIITVPQLVAANADVVGPKVGTSPDQVREWQSIADLLRAKGVGGPDAELLVKGGVRSVAHLAAADPTDLTHKLMDAERRRPSRAGAATVTPALVQKWIEAARAAR